MGGQSPVERKGEALGIGIASLAGPVRVEWDHEAALTPLGQLPFFVDFLKTTGQLEAFIADCPLRYTSPNAPKTRDVFGHGDAVDIVRTQALRPQERRNSYAYGGRSVFGLEQVKEEDLASTNFEDKTASRRLAKTGGPVGPPVSGDNGPNRPATKRVERVSLMALPDRHRTLRGR